ncbi:MAG: DNA polymerase III subunit gamma/tau [Bdellovibrionota bacterium]
MLLSQQSNQETQKNYIVLARRTRPQSFSELVGQEVVANSITSMLVSNKIPHAFLFTGTRGTGKTSSARILAKSLCCEKGPTPFPCQTCVHCKQITACSHDDILEIDGASNTGVDNVRELNEAARFYPHSAKFKIFIIDEVHMLSTGAFNALLKTLEEPPSQVVFILATTELHKVPITVRSRCMIFSFKKIEPVVIANHLKNILDQEKITFDEDAIQIIAREAKGSLRDSLSLLEQAIAICGGEHLDAQKTKSGLCVQGEELAEKIFSAICQKNSESAFEALQEANMASLDIATLIENTAALFRSAVLVKNLGNKERTLRLAQLLPREYEFLEGQAQGLSHAAISEIFKALSQSVREISRSTAPLAWAEMVVVDCILRADWLSATELMSLMGGGSSSNNSVTKTTNVMQSTPAIKTEPVIPVLKSAPVADSNSENLNLDLFKKFVEHTRQKSELLATKLKFVKINLFNMQHIEFADTQENATYLSFNEQDAAHFWSSIEEIGLGNAQIKGKYLPVKATKLQPQPLPQPQPQPQSKPQEYKESAKNMLKNFQKFSVPSASNTPSTSTKTVSLNEIVTKEKSKADMEKSNKILAKESVQELGKLATEMQVLIGG